MRPSDIGETIRKSALNTGRYLNEMAKSGLVQEPDGKKSFYEITDKDRDYLENPPEEIEGEELERTTQVKHRRELQEILREELQRPIINLI